MLRFAKVMHYPEIIDFGGLPEPVTRISDAINRLVQNLSDLKNLEKHFIFCRVVDDILLAGMGTTVQEAILRFASFHDLETPERVREKARPG
jgi:hypothetical protein